MIQKIDKRRELPWGLVLRFIYHVPRIVPTANKLTIVRHPGRKKSTIIRKKEAHVFCDHIKYLTMNKIMNMKRANPQELGTVLFPIAGAQCQLRVDILFIFCQKNRGSSRMTRSDLDNLKKGVFDGLQGALIDDDRWVVEGYAAKGKAAVQDREDIIIVQASRAGFRDAKAMEFLATMGPLPPWRREDRSKIILPSETIGDWQ